MSENVQTLIKRLEQNLVAAADDVDLRRRLVTAYLRAGDTRAAGEQCKEIARLHLRRMRLPLAVEALKEAAEHLPEDFRVLEQLYAIHRLADNGTAMVQVGVILADKLRKARQTERAEEILIRCLQATDDDVEPRRVLVETYVGTGRPDKAVPHARILAEKHPDARERRRFEKLAGELASRPVAGPSGTRAPASTPKPTTARVGGPPARWGWFAAGAAVAIVAGLGVWRHASAATLRGEVLGAQGLAVAGSLDAAAQRLREAGLEDLARAAEQARRSRLELEVRAVLGSARAGDWTVLPRLAEIATNGPLSAREEAQALAAALKPVEAHHQALRTALAAGDDAAAIDAWVALRDTGHLPAVLAHDPALADRELRLQVHSEPSGAAVTDGREALGTTPCEVRFPLGASRRIHLTRGRLGAWIDCANTDGAVWTVALARDIRWQADCGVVTGLTAAAGVVAVGTLGHELLLLDAETGSVRWRAALGPGGDVAGPPVIVGDRVLAATGAGRLVARRLADGSSIPELDGTAIRATPVLLPDGRVAAVFPDGAVRTLDAAGAAPLGAAPDARWCGLAGPRLVVVSRDRCVGIDWAGERSPWERTSERGYAGPPTVAGEWVVLPVLGGGVDAVRVDGRGTSDDAWKARSRAAAFASKDGLRCAAADGGLLLVEPLSGVSGVTREGGLADLGPVVGFGEHGDRLQLAATRAGWLTAWPRGNDAPTAGSGWPVGLGATPTTAPLPTGGLVLVGTDRGVVAAAGDQD